MTSQSWPGRPIDRPPEKTAGPDYPDKIKAHASVGGSPMLFEFDLFPYGRDNCPECGRPLRQFNPESHAVEHYGLDDPTPIREHYLPRVRRALILWQPIPE